MSDGNITIKISEYKELLAKPENHSISHLSIHDITSIEIDMPEVLSGYPTCYTRHITIKNAYGSKLDITLFSDRQEYLMLKG